MPVVGVDLPVSRLDGPRTMADGLASGFTQSETGAAFAAVHILIRSGANAGPDIYLPTITQQVRGANVAAMKLANDQAYQQLRATTQVTQGEPIPAADAQVTGYIVKAYNPRGATVVQVFLTSGALREQHRLLRFDVQLQWSGNDWRVIAPARGDWGSAAAPLSELPAGVLSYAGEH